MPPCDECVKSAGSSRSLDGFGRELSETEIIGQPGDATSSSRFGSYFRRGLAGGGGAQEVSAAASPSATLAENVPTSASICRRPG